MERTKMTQPKQYILSWGRAWNILALPYITFTAFEAGHLWEKHTSEAIIEIASTAIFLPIAMVLTRYAYSWYGSNVVAKRGDGSR
ncbi:MAG: hypothetical protein ACP5O6_08625 [Candidatus Baltobacteraceae bacterium]